MDYINDSKIQSKDWKKAFLIIACGQTVSIIGSSAVQFSLIWWLASETASPIMMSLAGLMAFFPQFFLGPFAGVWVDRWNRKFIIIGADLFIGLVAALFAISFLFWDPPIWSACVVLGIRAMGSVFHMPAIQAVVPMLVPQEELIRANGWSQFMQSGAFLVGPILGAAMYGALPLPVIMLSDLVGAIVASLTVAMVKIPETKKGTHIRRDFIGEIKEGAAVYLKDKKLFIITMASAVSMIFFIPLAMFYPLMTSDYFKATAWHASVTQIAYSLGMMVGALVLSRLGTVKNKLGAVHGSLFGLGVVSFLCGILPSTMTGFWIFAALCLAMGSSENFYNIPFVAYLQETVPNEAQGRAFSLFSSLMSAAMPIGLVIAAPLAERYGVPFWFAVAGIVMVIITVISAVLTFYER